MNIINILSIIDIVVLGALLALSFKRDLMMFQQNSYRAERYSRWLKKSGETTSYPRLIAVFLALFSLAGFGVARFALICSIVFAIIVSVRLLKSKYKKPLVFTRRAIRLYVADFIITLLITGAVVGMSFAGLFGPVEPLYSAAVILLIIYAFSHAVVFCSNFVLRPVENHINNQFYKNAAHKLAAMSGLKIIGITGSYGKTSTKHYLHRILCEHFETLMTPGSFNTTLGVVRTVNEYLKPYHQAFIVEMGAKQNGDIKEICELVHPSVGIITAVGPQHLETFGSIENVRDTKFELVDALPASGIAVINNDYPEIANREVSNCNCIRYSCEDDPSADYRATDITYNPEGSRFTLVCPRGETIEFETRLLGQHNISNLTAAIAVALQMQVPLDKIKYAVSRIEPVEHRLSVRRIGSGLTILDDAFNSNPVGSSMALKVLANMKAERRIIITPGMIELGDRQYELNSEFGRQIAQVGIDYVAIVGQYNKDAITEGLSSAGRDVKDILYFDSFANANNWLIAFANRGDVVLIENDLPDTFK